MPLSFSAALKQRCTPLGHMGFLAVLAGPLPGSEQEKATQDADVCSSAGATSPGCCGAAARSDPWPLSLPHVDHHPVAVDVSNLKVNPFTQAQTAGIDGAQADPIARVAYVPQDAAYLGDAEHHGQLLFPSWAHQIQRRPLSSECMLVEELDAA